MIPRMISRQKSLRRKHWWQPPDEIDQQLQAEQENGYTWDDPMVILNPYQISPLTAVVLFDTEEEYGVRFTVKGKTAAADISGEIDAASSHRVPIIGLYPGEDNTVVLELLDDSGRVKDSQEITITTEALPRVSYGCDRTCGDQWRICI